MSLKKMKKILFIRNGYFPADVRMRKQVNALLEENFEVDVLCFRENGEKFFEKSGKKRIIRVPITHKRATILRYFFEYFIAFLLFSIILTALSVFRRYNYIVVHTLPDFLSFSTIIPKIFGVKIYTDFHEPTPELFITKFRVSEKSLIIKFCKVIEQLVIRYSDVSTTVTQSLKNKYIERGADSNKIKVISNAIDESDFQVSKNLKKIKNENTFTLVSHGTIEERYGHETVIRAINELRIKYPNIRFLIPGGGTFVNSLIDLTEKLGCKSNIQFLGFLPFEELLNVLINSDAGIISMYRTPYSELIDTNKMYEYFQLGLPVIVSRLSPITENFTQNEVIFFEPGDYRDLSQAIENLILSPQKVNQYVMNASLKYEKLRWSVIKKSYIDLFK